jgi:O-antigen/teichoic acid export membrane protein
VTNADSRTLRERALAGFFWGYGAFVAGRLLVFAATVVLARLLDPEQFGLVAFALAILAYFDNLADLGVNETLVYRSDAKKTRVASTAFFLGIAGALVFTAALWIAAPYIADHSPDPIVKWIIRLLSLQILVASLGNAHQYLLRHSLEFKRLFVPEITSAFVKGAVSIGLAATGYGVWSLVWGQLAGSVTRTAVLWGVSSFRPVLAVERPAVRPMVGFGLNLSGVALLGEAVRNVDYLIVGVQLGGTALGLYLLAFRLPELAVASLFQVGYRVLFPFYSRLKDRDQAEGARGREELVAGYLRTVRLGSLVAFPAGLTIAALALPIVLTVYGEAWRDSALPLAFIAIWTGFSAINGLPGNVFKAMGRPGILTKLSFAYLVVLLPVLWFAAEFGIAAVAAAQAGLQAVYFVVLSFVVSRVLGVPATATPRSALPAIVLSAVTAAAIFPLGRLLPPAAALALGLPAAASLYLGLVRLILPAELSALLRALKRLRGRERPLRDEALLEPLASVQPPTSGPGL